MARAIRIRADRVQVDPREGDDADETSWLLYLIFFVGGFAAFYYLRKYFPGFCSRCAELLTAVDESAPAKSGDTRRQSSTSQGLCTGSARLLDAGAGSQEEAVTPQEPARPAQPGFKAGSRRFVPMIDEAEPMPDLASPEHEIIMHTDTIGGTLLKKPGPGSQKAAPPRPREQFLHSGDIEMEGVKSITTL